MMNGLQRVAATTGVLSVICMEAGWVVTEVGRQPWIVYNLMRVEDAATAYPGVRITFIAVVVLYAALGTTTILVLRGMSRRFRLVCGFVDHDTPYGPEPPLGVEDREMSPRAGIRAGPRHQKGEGKGRGLGDDRHDRGHP